jgi:hypothetical protein
MTGQQVIDTVIKANSYLDVFSNIEDWKNDFNSFIQMIHPDKCHLQHAQYASAKLLEFRKALENGVDFNDDAGLVTYFPKCCIFKGKEDLLKLSLKNYNKLISFNNKKDLHFHKYLPNSLELKNKQLVTNFEERALPLSSIKKLPQEHVNWVLSRLLEISTWFDSHQIYHGGINLDSIFIVPKTHGIIVTSFYHLTEIDKIVKTISGKYKLFYPNVLFTTKKASSFIDIELSKRVAAYLLGDVSGNGAGLRKICNEDFINFLLKYDVRSSFDIFKDYRELLKRNFETKFYHLNI